MSGWSLIYNDFKPEQQRLREALCTLGNGYFAIRGAAPEAEADETHYPGTYVAGCYNRLTSEIVGRVIENEDLVNLVNGLPLTFRIDEGPWFDLREVKILSYRQELDLKEGMLLRHVHFEDTSGKITELKENRLVHMAKPHLAALEITIKPENWSGPVTVRSALDGRIINSGVERYKDLNGKHLMPVEADDVDQDTICLTMETCQSHIRISHVARTRFFLDGQPIETDRQTQKKPESIAHEAVIDLPEGSRLTVEKILTLYTSRDHAISGASLEAVKTARRASSFEALAKSHKVAWRHLWHHCDIVVEGKEAGKSSGISAILRLHLFHILQTCSLNSMDMDVGVPARGLTGEAYRGHVFWDELFIFPTLNLRMPEITRALLMYRYRRLNEARAAARKEGYRGAVFPWQSGSNGREESQKYHLNPRSGRWLKDNSRRQRHINSAIAYNVWQYVQVTDDLEFLSFYGAEMIYEIARFWASVATYNETAGRYEINGVMGPDEYHDGYPDFNEPGLKNNAYTNLMAVWVLSRALELRDKLPGDQYRNLCDKLNLSDREFAHWNVVSRNMRLVFHDDGIISQFEGYGELAEFDWEDYRNKYGDIQRLDRILEAEGDTPNRYKASKQADVLMLFYLFSSEEISELFERLGYDFEYETIPKNVEYYLARTSYGSTLSNVVHSWVLARSDRTRSGSLFDQALQSDVADIQGGTTPEGVHLGAMAGTVDMIQRCYTGIETRGDVLYLNPCLPEDIVKLSFRIRYCGHSLAIEINQDHLLVKAVRCAAGVIKIGIENRVHELGSGCKIEFTLSRKCEPIPNPD